MFAFRNGLKQGEALSPLLFNFGLMWADYKGSGKPEWIDTECYTSRFYVDIFNILAGNVQTVMKITDALLGDINPLSPGLNPICYLLALLAHVSRIRVKSLTLRLLMSYIYIYIYIYGAPIFDVSRSHTTTQHSR
jgi:hypothetical protein